MKTSRASPDVDSEEEKKMHVNLKQDNEEAQLTDAGLHEPSKGNDGTEEEEAMNIWNVPWKTPKHILAPLQDLIGEGLAEIPIWFNHADSGALSVARTQAGSTCGLFAVSHAIASAAALGEAAPSIISKGAFGTFALQANIGDIHANLFQKGSENYDVAVLHANLQYAKLRVLPMQPATLQGDTPDTSRLQKPFADHIEEN